MTAAAAMVLVVFALPAGATVDEISGMPCSDGHAVFGPPGITGESHADNLANPLFATGFATITPYPDGGQGAILISFNEDHPASKIRLLGVIVPTEEPGVFVTAFEWDDTKPFANCAKFSQPHH